MRNFIKRFKTYKVSPFGWVLLVAFSCATYYDGGISNVITLWIFAPILYVLGIIINILQNPPASAYKGYVEKFEEDSHEW